MSDKKVPANAAAWLAEAGNDKLTPAQRAALADWLRESPAHVREFLQMTLVRQDLEKLEISPGRIEAWVEEAKAAASEPIPVSEAQVLVAGAGRSQARGRRGFSGVSRLQSVWLSAACLVVALVAGGTLFWWESGRYTTSFGEQRIVTLADGSVIEINTDSALQVNFSAQRRAIRMIRGEAFFRVAHDTARPFVVSAGEADVKAVGTQFNVRLGNGATLVSVVEGTVEVRDDASVEPSVRVSTGEEASIVRSLADTQNRRVAVAKVAHPSPQRAASWTRGRVEFEDLPLIQVLREFERYRNVQVTVDDEGIRQLRLTGSFDAHDPNSALAFIATLPGVRVEEIDARTFRIHREDRAISPRP